jgi:hypothetical protein
MHIVPLVMTKTVSNIRTQTQNASPTVLLPAQITLQRMTHTPDPFWVPTQTIGRMHLLSPRDANVRWWPARVFLDPKLGSLEGSSQGGARPRRRGLEAAAPSSTMDAQHRSRRRESEEGCCHPRQREAGGRLQAPPGASSAEARARAPPGRGRELRRIREREGRGRRRRGRGAGSGPRGELRAPRQR